MASGREQPDRVVGPPQGDRRDGPGLLGAMAQQGRPARRDRRAGLAVRAPASAAAVSTTASPVSAFSGPYWVYLPARTSGSSPVHAARISSRLVTPGLRSRSTRTSPSLSVTARLNFLTIDARVVHHVDQPGVTVGRLAHLRRRILQVHHPGAGTRHHRLGDDERVAEAVVEARREVTGDLDVLALVLADGHLVGVVQEDVGGHQRRVAEQPGRDEVGLALGELVLELGHPAELAEAGLALHHPGELGVLGDVALDEHRGHVAGRGRPRTAPRRARRWPRRRCPARR